MSQQQQPSTQQLSHPVNGNAQAISGEDVLSEDEARKRREQLNRRPSYRMILKDLEASDKVLKKEPDETPPASVDTSPLQVHIPPHPPLGVVPGSQGVVRGVPPVSAPSPYASPLSAGSLLPNAAAAAAAAAVGLPPHPMHLNGVGDLSHLQHGLDFAAVMAAATSSQQNSGPIGLPMPADAHVLKPLVSMDPSAFQCSGRPLPDPFLSALYMANRQNVRYETGSLASPTVPPEHEDWQSPMLSGYSSSPSPTLAGGSRGMGMGGCEDESTRKRQVRLLKNREAAKECRRKKKEYVKCLENRVAVLENQNKALIEELKTLKELYCRKEKSEMQ